MQHPGRFLRESFMEPMGLSASAVACAISVPRSRLSEVLSGNRGISVDTANRLGMYFGVNPTVFTDRQIAWDLARLPPVKTARADTRGFLVGPLGATPIPEAQHPPAPRSVAVSGTMLERLRAKAAHSPPDRPGTMVEATYPSGQRAMENKAR